MKNLPAIKPILEFLQPYIEKFLRTRVWSLTLPEFVKWGKENREVWKTFAECSADYE